jgi:peptide/nickel transport system substrate-binding protein
MTTRTTLPFPPPSAAPRPRGRRTRLAAVLVAALALVLGLTACGRGSSSGAGSSTPTDGGTLVGALSGDPQTLDMAQNSGALTIYTAQNVFEQLFIVDKTFTPRPMLATGYDVSQDGLTYTIPLRQGVKFHNGKPMTADDVVASLQRWEQVSGGGKLVAADVASLTAKDPATVQIVLKARRYSLINDLANYIQGAIIVPADIAKAAGTKPMSDDQIIGTGPYKLQNYAHGQRVILERNPDYSSLDEKDWGGFAGAKHGYFDKIELRFVPDPTQQLNGLQSGQFQWAQAVSPDQYTTIKDNKSLNVTVSDGGQVNTVLLNHNGASPFANLAARQAMNMVIDKKAMATAAFGPDVVWSPLTGSMVLSVDKPMFSDAGNDVYSKFDLDGAKALFAQAGVTPDKTIRIATTQTYPRFYQMAVVMQAQLQKIGLKAQVDVYDFPTMIDRLTSQPTSWDISMTGFGGTIGSLSQALYLTPTWPGEYRSEAMNALLAKYDQSTSPDQAAAVVTQAQQLIWQEIPVIAISPNRNLMVSSAKVKDLSTFNPAIFWNAYPSK